MWINECKCHQEETQGAMGMWKPWTSTSLENGVNEKKRFLGGEKKLELTEEVERTFQEKEMVKWNDWDRI